MVRLGRSDGIALVDRATLAAKNPKSFKIALLVSLLIAVWIYHEQNILNGEDGNEDYHHVFSNPLERCLDVDDPDDWAPFICECTDPLKPARRRESTFDRNHNNLVEIAKRNRKRPDFVLLGDSITELWMETLPQYFPRGIALGLSGDTSPNLLYHLQHDLLTNLKTATPKLFIILIGTNDLGRTKCSKRSTLAGILNVAQYLHTECPNVPILVHGLLPRSDSKGEYHLGHYWEQILWINRELKRFCALHQHWHYMEAGNVFLKSGEDGDPMIIPELMQDGLHPTDAGYERWAPVLKEQIKALSTKKDKQ